MNYRLSTTFLNGAVTRVLLLFDRPSYERGYSVCSDLLAARCKISCIINIMVRSARSLQKYLPKKSLTTCSLTSSFFIYLNTLAFQICKKIQPKSNEGVRLGI